MTRVNVYERSDEDGDVLVGWFDRDAAELFEEDTYWVDGNEYSIHTYNKWIHERLYRTAGGRWVLEQWSQWQGSQPRYSFLTDVQASLWLLKNHSDDVVERFFGPVESEHGPAIEIERGKK